MKKYYFIISVLISLNLSAQQPSLFQFTPTNSSGVMYGQAQIDGIPATANDWIAAFDASGNCCGATQMIMNSGIAYINLAIYGDDATTPTIDEGMNANEDFSLRIYQYSTQQYIDYPSNTNLTTFSGWVNTNGSPLLLYSNVGDVYNFMNTSNVTLSLNLQLCENDNPIQLTGGSPSGGLYFGNGVNGGYFDPATAGGGIHNVSYTVNNDTAVSMITVYSLADGSFITNGPFCSNENSIPLTNVTPGGIYSGSGIVSGTFNPDMLGVGSYWVSYTLTDNNNCTQTVDQLFVVNSAPSPPTISQNNNTLTCNSVGVSYQWLDQNLSPIVGEINSTFSPVQNGSYYVEVSNINCSEVSEEYNFNLTSIDNVINDLLIIDNKILVGDLKSNLNLEIRDVLGRKIYSSRLQHNEIINLDLIKQEIVFIIIYNASEVITQKYIL